MMLTAEWPTLISGDEEKAHGSHLTPLRVGRCAACDPQLEKPRRRCRYDILRGVYYCSEACWRRYTSPDRDALADSRPVRFGRAYDGEHP